MLRSCLLSLCLVIASTATTTMAQDYENNPNYVKVSHWEMHVLAGGGRVVEKQGPFPDWSAAHQAALLWSKDHSDNIGLITSEKEIVNYQLINRGGVNRQQDPAHASRSSSRPGSAAPAERLGGRWDGECGPFYFKNGVVQHLCKGQPFSGSYSLQGNSLVISIGPTTIRGTVVGNTISATLFKHGAMVRDVTIRKTW